ncbi:hypothetical protein L0664_13325 [Octadecabacter sp. G9-8]|uniref:Uncharacterized protein n=1 Tax=Octadecabacter dasysiphoniae TaxID=2909341 RepID=A0ABS9CXS2_9RHOB|nr:hypothetical protein [Octadecabacter dasysiphoniae]MCF2872050.1 hypothetical protein [Octadecabacter dasysiphoniae]
MIGLGFRARQAGGAADSDIGMLDISANALAVLILATMLVLTVASPPTPRGEVRSDDRPELFYPSPLDVAVVPQSAYWIVTDAGMTLLDLDAIAVGLVDGAAVAATAQAEATLTMDRRGYRDLNDHRMSLNLEWGALRDTALPITTTQEAIDLSTLVTDAFVNTGQVPTFVVTPAGTEAFSAIYWDLRAQQVPTRWVPIEERTPLVFTRRASNFETRSRQWQ